jgi:hypothetical protein
MGEVPDSAALDALLEAALREGGPTGAEAELAERLVRVDPVTEALASAGCDVRGAAAERLGMFGRAAALCPRVELDVAGHEVAAGISRRELWRFYLPLCQAALQAAGRVPVRALIGVAGSGASGKSVFAELLREVFSRAAAGADLRAAVCPLDGFHYSNAYLDAHFGAGEEGEGPPGRALKGLPQTFDADAFVRALAALRSRPSVAWPRYDRRIHDPVPDGVRVGPAERVVFVEGNFLLLDRPPWDEAAGLLDLSLFLLQPLATVREAMIARHVAGGRSPDEAEEHFQRVDGPNYELCLRSARRADLLVRRDEDQRVVGLEAAPFDSPAAP